MGNLPFPDPDNVYFSMINVFMETGMHNIEFCLDNRYHTLIYNGNFDIICNHSAILDMNADMQWEGNADYDKASRSVYYGSEVVGYLKQAMNLDTLRSQLGCLALPLTTSGPPLPGDNI